VVELEGSVRRRRAPFEAGHEDDAMWNAGTRGQIVGLSVLLLNLVTVTTAGGSIASTVPAARVRTLDAPVRDLLLAGWARSATLRDLMARFDRSGWLVFVQSGPCPEKAALGCLLHVVGRYEGRPYLRINVDVHRQHPDAVVATLGHEMQHALEVAESPDVIDAPTLRALFARIGTPSVRSRHAMSYETPAAVEIGVRVLREMQTKVDRRVRGISDRARVRSSDAATLDELHEGCARSPTFTSLVAQLNETRMVVYVEPGICGVGHSGACPPQWVTLAGGDRFVRILVDPQKRGAHRLSRVAREFQHALEIGRAENIRNANDVSALFRHMDRMPLCPSGSPDCHAMSAALDVGETVLNEILASYSRASQ
jgi:hypothetical protein